MRTAIFRFADRDTCIWDMWVAFRSLTGLPICHIWTEPHVVLANARYYIKQTEGFVLCEVANGTTTFQHNIPGAKLIKIVDSPVAKILALLQASANKADADQPTLTLVPDCHAVAA